MKFVLKGRRDTWGEVVGMAICMIALVMSLALGAARISCGMFGVACGFAHWAPYSRYIEPSD